MGITIYQADAFTDRPFTGNPAAVCILEEPKTDEWMQNVALEMNLSETAFLQELADGYNLRWFTPAVEVKLCGHATLAGAHILWETGRLKEDETARFQTLSGLLTAARKGEIIELDFPATPETPAEPPRGLTDALGINSPEYVGKNLFDYLVVVDSEKTVRELSPDFTALKRVPARGIIVTARSDGSDFDFVSRFFAPAAGVNEDPVTGSAHCCLGPYWSRQLGKKQLTGYQASARGGLVQVHAAGDRVQLGGKAVTVMKGEFFADH